MQTISPLAGSDPNALFVLENSAGTRVVLSPYGARVVEVHTRGRDDKLQNIALTFNGLAAYDTSGSFAGATIGPVAGRIPNGRLVIEGKSYALAKNDGENTLHGGTGSLSHMLWLVRQESDGVCFSCALAHGLGGFPGNRTVSVQYSLDETNTLSIRYTAATDRPTFLNLTNHLYWNLSGDFSDDAYGHRLEISSGTVLYNNAEHLPIGGRAVKNTLFDFTRARSVRDAMNCDLANPQLANANGYNNAYLLDRDAAFSARLTHEGSGRRVTVCTDYPYLVFYSGGYLPSAGCALALEAQYAPAAQEPVLQAGETYSKYISFRFDTL